VENSTDQRADERAGILAGFAAYAMWGVFPLYFVLLEPASAIEILCHRIIWSLLLMAIVLRVRGDHSWIDALRGNRRMLAQVALAGVLLTINWLTYIWAATNERVIEGSIGYFIGPLVTVALGVLVLRERLRPVQWAAVGLGAMAVVVLTFGYGRLPWVSLVLATTFAAYGFLKKRIALSPAESLAAETAVVAPFAVIILLVLMVTGESAVLTEGPGEAALLILAGPITAAPLLCFAFAARRIPLTVIGLLQYLTPTLQFFIGFVILGETLTPGRWAGMALIWIALILLTSDALVRSRRVALRPA
jgi:chloramphenicol-sensitive protein RarD